jgi:Dyp-type peroxidase family
MPATDVQTIGWDDVQGMVLRGYGKHPYSTNLLLQVDDAAGTRAWLGTIASRITTCERAKARLDECYLNLAFTKTGLARLGLSADVLASFPTAFFEGMASENRSRILGDSDDNAPQNWAWGGLGKEVDAILMIFAKQPGDLDQAVKAEQAAMTGVSLKYDRIDTRLWDDQKEHFGFHDGVSQPVIEGSPPLAHRSTKALSDSEFGASNVIKAGEFVLGYLNEYGVLPDPVNLPAGTVLGNLPPVASHAASSAGAPDLGHNGTYLVVRQVAQFVPELWNYLDTATKGTDGKSSPDARERLAAKLVGRWTSGAPVVLAPDQDDPRRGNDNDFVYKAIDPDGFKCPYSSHIRRANPRDTLGDDPQEALKLSTRHRLIRRGRSYGPRAANYLDLNDKQERGLMFMCIGANIERQFEFVQQTWIDNPSFNGLYDERDAIFGNRGSQATGSMTIPRQPVRRRLGGLGGFVAVRGGAYFFLPSIKALCYFAMLK